MTALNVQKAQLLRGPREALTNCQLQQIDYHMHRRGMSEAAAVILSEGACITFKSGCATTAVASFAFPCDGFLSARFEPS